MKLIETFTVVFVQLTHVLIFYVLVFYAAVNLLRAFILQK